MERQRIARVLVAALLTTSQWTWSDEVRADPKSDAQTLFEAGREAAKRGECPSAIDHFSRARALYPTAGSLYNIADCEERIGKLVLARAHWTELLGQLPARDQRVTDAKAHIEALDRRIPTVKIALPPGAPAGTSMTLDGAPVASEKVGVEQSIDPGQHAVLVTAPGHARGSTTVVVSEGARGLVVRGELGAVEATPSVTPSIAAAPAAPPPSESVSRGSETSQAKPVNRGESSPSTLAYVAGSVGVAGFAAAALGTAVLLGKKSTIADHCNAIKECDDTGLDAAHGISTWNAISTVGFGAGVLGVAGFFLLPRESAKEASSATRDPAREARTWAPRAVMLTPTVGSSFVGTQFTGTW